MKGKSIAALTFVLAFAAGVFLLLALGPQAHAQKPCLEFRAIWHATLPSPIPFLPTDTWGGPVYASLGGEFLLGNLSGNDGDSSGHGTIGQARGGSYKICFGDCTDSFTYEVSNAVFPFPPGKVGVGYYRGNTAKIVRGTGRFQFASGNLNVAAPFIVWTPDGGTTWLGRGSGDISGNICGVQ